MKVDDLVPHRSFRTATKSRSEKWFSGASRTAAAAAATTAGAAVSTEAMLFTEQHQQEKPTTTAATTTTIMMMNKPAPSSSHLWATSTPHPTAWKEMQHHRRHPQATEHFAVPEFIVVKALQWILDDDAVSDLNSEADLEDEDCLPEATIQVLEAVFGVIPLDLEDDEDEEGYTTTADKEFSFSTASASSTTKASSDLASSVATLDLSLSSSSLAFVGLAIVGRELHPDRGECNTEAVPPLLSDATLVKARMAGRDDVDTTSCPTTTSSVGTHSFMTLLHAAVSATTSST